MIAWDHQQQHQLGGKRDSLYPINKYPGRKRNRVLFHFPFSERNSSSVYHEFMDEFCENSSIHGIKYMGDRKRHWIERLWWLVAFVLSIYGCSRLIYNAWQRWEHNPVIVSFSEKTMSISEIPFPAVTICPETKTDAEMFNFTCMFRKLKDHPEEEFLKYSQDE